MRLGVVALTVLMAPTPLIGSSVAMGVLLFLAGFAIAPTLIGAVSFIEQTVPASRLTEGIAMLHTDDGRRHRAGRRHRRCRRRRARRRTRRTSSRWAPGSSVCWPPSGPAGDRSIGSRSEHLDELVASGDGPTDA